MSLRELLAPAGSYDVFIVAINAGADAVYLAGKKFGARAFAQNFTIEEIEKSVEYAHLNGSKVFVTVNTLINNFEIKEFLDYIFDLYKIGIDAVIVQDFGIVNLIKELFPNLKIHASTQMTLNNYNSVLWAYENGISRVIFPREVNIHEIAEINTKLIKNNINMELEVFGHGALCYSVSGNCYMSSLNSGRSGNRGACAQPCRRGYKLKYKGYNVGNGFLLSTHDLNTSKYLNEISDAGITSLKLEGRLKSEDYIGTIVNTYRNILDNKEGDFEKDLNLVFNRKFTKGYLLDEKPGKVMGRESSGHEGYYIGDVVQVDGEDITILKKNKITIKTGDGIAFKHNKKIKGIYLDNIIKQDDKYLKLRTTRFVKEGDKVFISYSKETHHKLKKFKNQLIKSKIPISIDISWNDNLQLNLKSKFKIEDQDFQLNYTSSSKFEKAINRPITEEEIINQFSKTGNTPFFIDKINIKNMPENIFIPLKELNTIRRTILDKNTKLLLDYNKPSDINEIKMNLNDFLNSYDDLNSEKIVKDKLSLSVFVDNLDLLKVACNYPIRKIYFDPSYLYNNPDDFFNNIKNILKEASQIASKVELVWVLPSFISDGEVMKCMKILNELENEGIPLAIMGDVPGLNKSFNCNIYGNHNLNVWNSFTVENLENSAFKSLIISSELSNNEIKELTLKSHKNNMNLELFV
ncbi:U32 family peptidase, partial [Methanobrevibacter sp. OttesenSCG-928-K11]|nr:U32 family peptidase [Methanobrevibacter sp. OttesenSCG-928-K11]